MSLAFEKVRILDFSQLLAGPMATHQLALLGADVIKIERPGVGDQFAGVMHTPESRMHGRSFPFQAANLNKRSLAIDLKRSESIAIILKIAETCDAIVENFSVGVMARLGLDFDTLRKHNPEIVYCSVSGYGQKGPNANIAAYDGTIQAASGMMSITGDARSGPMRTGYVPVDAATALMAAFALSAGLYRKLATGRGQYIDVSMMDTAVVLQTPSFINYMNSGVTPSLMGNRSVTGSPTSDSFATQDGHVLLTTVSAEHVEILFNTLGLGCLLSDPRYADEQARRQNETSLRPILERAFASQTSKHWRTVLTEHGVACAVIQSVPDVAADAHFEHRGLFERVPTVTGSASSMITVTTGFLSTGDSFCLNAAPALGEHTREILTEAGYTEENIAEFVAMSII